MPLRFFLRLHATKFIHYLLRKGIGVCFVVGIRRFISSVQGKLMVNYCSRWNGIYSRILLMENNFNGCRSNRLCSAKLCYSECD